MGADVTSLTNSPNRLIGDERLGLEGTGLLAAIVQSSNDGIISADLDGTILSWNPGAERIFGFAQDEVIGRSIAALTSPALHDEQQRLIDRLKKGEHVHYETVRHTKAGTRIDVSLTLSPIRDSTGRIAGISGIVQDITARRLSEQALLRRLTFEKFLFDLSKRFIGLTDEEVDTNMTSGLAHVAEFLDMDRVTLLELSRDRAELAVIYSWSAPGVMGPPARLAQPWWVGQVLRGEVSLMSDVNDLPEEAASEKEYLRQRGILSAASIPLRVAGQIAGAIAFVTVHRRVTWTEDLVNELRAIGDILWNALKRHQTMQALRAARETAERALRESQALRASEDRYRGLAEQVVDAVLITDATGRPTDANMAGCELLGYTLEELKTLRPEDVLAAEDLPEMCNMLRLLANGQIVRKDWRFRRKDGSMFSGEVVGRQLPDGRIQAVVRDITQHKEAEEIQRRLHELAVLRLDKADMNEVLGAIVEAAIVIAHADFGNLQLLDVESSNLRIAAQRGFPEWWLAYWQNVPKGHGTCGTALGLGRRLIVEDVEQSPIFSAADLDVQRRAGVRAVQSTPLTSRLGKPIGLLSTHYKTRCRLDERTLQMLDLLAREAADIIGHAQVEAELTRQAALLDLATNSIFVSDGNGCITYWNEGAARTYGWSKEEAIGKVSHVLLQTEFPEPLERIIDIVKRTGHWEGELVHSCRDGRRLTVDSRWVIEHGASPDSVRILEINSDITPRKQAESERKRLEQERAEQSRRKDEFLAFMGHELRNPLAAILTAIHVLSRSDVPAQRARLEEIISRQATIMRRLVDDLLELERITHGRIELKLDPLDLADCLHRAAAAVQAIVASRDQELLLHLPSDSVRFVADGTRLDQIVGNLLTNASKYSPRGARIELSGAREASSVVIRCKDNGQGIWPEHQQKIFEPFSKGPKTDLGYGEPSIGLGLALVKQLTELHGGTISVESGGAGLGSEFTVRLPFVAPPSVQDAPSEPKPVRVSRRPRSVVIVEDNSSVATALQAALEQAGHLVHSFADGPSALADVSSLTPDAFLIDIGLPGMDGYELAAKLKQQTNTKGVPLIAISGFKRRDQADAQDHFDQYFNKPVDVPTLLALLDQS